MKRAVLLAAFVACSTEEVFVELEPGLERMLSQPRYDAYEASRFFSDGRAMQAPPENTLALGAELDPARTRGYVGERYVERIPITVDAALLERGRERFDIYCAPCHGARGDGLSVVGRNMSLVQPRSLLIDRVQKAPDGRLFRVISEGYGLMAAYAPMLVETDRWAVVAYVRALGLASHAVLAELPEPARARALEALR